MAKPAVTVKRPIDTTRAQYVQRSVTVAEHQKQKDNIKRVTVAEDVVRKSINTSDLRVKKMETEVTRGAISTRHETSMNGTRMDQMRSGLTSQAAMDYASITSPGSPVKSRGMTGTGLRQRPGDAQNQWHTQRRNTMNQSAARGSSNPRPSSVQGQAMEVSPMMMRTAP